MSLNGSWVFQVDSLDKGLEEEWYRPGADRSTWSPVQVPDYWDRYNLEEYDGVGWYRTTISVGDTSQSLALFFSGVDDDADVWLDGQKVGSHVGYSEPFHLDLPPGLKPGVKELIVRVSDHGGPGGIYKPVHLGPREKLLELYKSEYSDQIARQSEDWVRDAVIYEVYLRSFSREGNFKALERRLPELKSLGVSVLWLMPIHPIGDLNRKGKLGSPYSIQDYYAVNPEFGTLDDFKSLVGATHALGMKIIIDLVANHTSWDSKLLTEHTDWFTTNERGAIVAPNADWNDVADLNYDHHELRKYMIEMMKYWVGQVGIDGYRCDVAELVPIDFWNRARKELDKIKPVIMLSEGTLPEHHVEAFDLTYSWSVYDVFAKIINGTTPVRVFDDILRTESYQFPKGSLRLRFNTNHDKNVYDADAPAVKKFTPAGAKATALLTFTFPGVPLLYNGEEVGNEKQLSLFEKVDVDWSKNAATRSFYEALTRLRTGHISLRRGEYLPVKNSEGHKVYTFLRRSGADEVLVVINFAKERRSVIIDAPAGLSGELKEYFTTSSVSVVNGQLTADLGALEFRVYVPAR
jgi:glycosidase